MNQPPLVVHLIYRLAIGGLENGLVNLINRMPADRYRHAIICVSDFTDFKNRITRDDVEVYALHKKPGNDLGAYWRLWKLLRKLKPTIVHSRNIGTLEYSLPSLLAGVPYRIHGEHGRDMMDIDGSNKKYITLRRIYQPLIHRFIALSRDLDSWLVDSVAISRDKVVQLYNGVNREKFQLPTDVRDAVRRELGLPINAVVAGTVGRLQAEKDQATLIKAFQYLQSSRTDNQSRDVHLMLVGDGPDRSRLEGMVKGTTHADRIHFIGARNDVPRMLAAMDVFILPSLGEGISNTILEAMASGLPVVATSVGGNPELVVEGETGFLVPSADPGKMAEAIKRYQDEPSLMLAHGAAGRKRVEQMFSMEAMVQRYMDVYDAVIVNR